MTTIPLKHDATSLLKQLAITIHNLKHVPLQEIIESDGCLEAYATIGRDYAQIGSAIASYMVEANRK